MRRNVPPEAPQVGLCAFFVAGCGDRNDVIKPRIHGPRDATDGAALAGGIHALEHHHDRPVAHFLVARQQAQLTLQFFELAVVVLVIQLARIVRGIEDIEFVETGLRQRLWRGSSRCGALQAALHRVEQQFPRRQRPVFMIAAIDDVPWRFTGRCFAQRQLAHADKFVVALEVLPVFLADPPGGLLPGRKFLQTGFLRVFGKVEPEFDDQRAFGHEHAFVIANARQSMLEFRAAFIAKDALKDRIGIPGAKQDADAPLGRQRRPEAPHLRSRTLDIGGSAERMRMDVARIHPFVEQVYRLALARAIDAVNKDDYRKLALFQQSVLDIQQRAAEFGFLAPKVGFFQLVANFSGFKHGMAPERVHDGCKCNGPR